MASSHNWRAVDAAAAWEKPTVFSLLQSGMPQSPLQTAQRYVDAWNRRDADAIVATFADGGTYTDPSTPMALTGAAIGVYATRLWAAFPDLSFDIVSVTESASGCGEFVTLSR